MSQDPRTHGLWAASSPPAPPTAELVGDVTADVAIVGGGFTGCSAALHLAEMGAEAVVLEAEEIGFGGSGRNVGLVNAGMWVMPDDVPRELGETHGERLLAQLGEAPRLVFDIVARYGVDCEAETAGTLHCAVGKGGFAEIEERARQWRTRGADVELLDASAAAELIGSKAYSGALLDRRAGTIQPLAYVRGLARAAIGNGATIHTHSPVVAREDLGTAWRIATPNGSVTAKAVIIATDAYSSGIWSGLRQEQVMLPYFQLATQPLGHNLRQSILPGRQGAWDTQQVLSSFRFDRAGRLLIGSVGALRGTGAAIHRDWGRRQLLRLFPQLRGVAFEHAWFGMIGMTDNALPRLHAHGRNSWSISGYNGRGIAPGTTFGRDLARLATGEVAIEELSLPASKLTSAPLRAAKAAFYEIGAQALHLTEARF